MNNNTLKGTVGELIALRRGLARVAKDFAALKLKTGNPESGQLHALEAACVETSLVIDLAMAALPQRLRAAVMPIAKYSKTIDTRAAR